MISFMKGSLFRFTTLPKLFAVIFFSFAIQAVSYGFILGPVSNAFNDPIHANTLTSFGKLIMREFGWSQVVAVILALLCTLFSQLLPNKLRYRILVVAYLLLVYTVVLMILQVGMIVSWGITLWHFSESMANEMATANETALWPFVDWRIQLLTGLFLMIVATFCALLSIRRSFVVLFHKRGEGEMRVESKKKKEKSSS